jgi:hypothetical protein
MDNESLKTIVTGLMPHVRNTLELYGEEAKHATPTMHAASRNYMEGYLLGTYKSGTLLHKHFVRLMNEIKTAYGHRVIAACFNPTNPITEGERSLYRYKFEATGSFERALWEAFFAADSSNLANLTNGFPSHSEAFRQYATESGWWDTLVARIKGGE